MRDTYMRISLGAIRRNAEKVLNTCSGADCLGVVKADAYGHDAVAVSRVLTEAGFRALAVARTEEGLRLRENGIALPVLVLGVSGAEAAEAAVEAGLTLTVSELSDLDVISEAAKKTGRTAQVHLKLDTGMTRIGLRGEKELSDALDTVSSLPRIRVAGAYTHFCDVADADFTDLQNARFSRLGSIVKKRFPDCVLHAAASYASERKALRYDMIRAGVVLYGGDKINGPYEFAQTLITHPVRIARIRAGETVGYSRRFTAERDTTVMTIPVGYADGYPRVLGNHAFVLAEGRRAPIIGNICMDMMMADVTDIPGVTRESEIVLLGRQGSQQITPVELAKASGTIAYEIMTGFTSRIMRLTDE